MNKQPKNDYMGDADDILYAIRMMAGTGTTNIDSASEKLREMLDLYNDASRYDRECGSDRSAMVLSYVLSQFELAIDHLKGLPASNRSRTAQQARMYRAG